ncbi:MAG TPA: hypothetical protein VI911_08755 [Patescibacteria group bacterium]|nr:MAG: hypothetical protein UR43_C0005G0081 [candidate division TM6 bacterium GW2011_GWF2_33_332]HLD91086.1 hypothetical protein [Patescibacteria group bacterium]
MKKIITTFVLLSLLTTNILAMTPVKKDDKVPYDGYLFTSEEESKLRQTNEEKIKLEDLNVLKDRKIEIQELRLDGYKKYVDETKDLAPMGTWERIGWFFLGVGVTGVGFYTTSKIIKNTSK